MPNRYQRRQAGARIVAIAVIVGMIAVLAAVLVATTGRQ
jgi:hypothetical protein